MPRASPLGSATSRRAAARRSSTSPTEPCPGSARSNEPMKRLFVANWKMNSGRAGARQYARLLAERIGAKAPSDRELAVAPPFTAFSEASDPEGRWALAAQTVASHASGAFTGETSASMAAEAGCRYAIVGHSERRRLFGENAETLAARL